MANKAVKILEYGWNKFVLIPRRQRKQRNHLPFRHCAPSSYLEARERTLGTRYRSSPSPPPQPPTPLPTPDKSPSEQIPTLRLHGHVRRGEISHSNSNSNSNRIISKGYIPSRQMCRCACAHIKNTIMLRVLNQKKASAFLKMAHDDLFESLYRLLFNDTIWPIW